jgi:hypothetical protein
VHLSDGLDGGRAEQIRDELKLVNHVLAGKQRPPAQHLSKYAANAPQVDGRRVLAKKTPSTSQSLPLDINLENY